MTEKYFILNMKVGPSVSRFSTSVPRKDLINRGSTSPEIWCMKQPSWATSGQRSQSLTLDEGQVGHLHRATNMHEGMILKSHSSQRAMAQWQDHFPGSRTPRPNAHSLTSLAACPALPIFVPLQDKSAGYNTPLPQQSRASSKPLRDLEPALIVGISNGI